MLTTLPPTRRRWLQVFDQPPRRVGFTSRLSLWPPRPSPERSGWLIALTYAAVSVRGRESHPGTADIVRILELEGGP